MQFKDTSEAQQFGTRWYFVSVGEEKGYGESGWCVYAVNSWIIKEKGLE